MTRPVAEQQLIDKLSDTMDPENAAKMVERYNVIMHEEVVRLRLALAQILEISYEGHADGRATRLELISRLASRTL